MWPFSIIKSRRDRVSALEEARQNKVLSSQKLLLDAATMTADAAQEVTSTLKQRLEDSMRQFELTSLVLNDGLIVCDARANITSFNPAAERIFRITADAAMSTKVTSLFDLDVTENSSLELQDVLRRMTLVQGITGSGERIDLEVSMARLDRHDGSATYLLIAHNPCLECDCKDAMRYRRLFETNSNGVLVVQNNHIVAANEVAAARLGKTVDNIVDFPISRVTGGEDALAVMTTRIEWDGAPACLMTLMETPSPFEIETARRGAANMICCFAPDFTVTFANKSFADRYGAGRASLAGLDIRDLIPSVEFDPFHLNMSSLTAANPHKRLYLHTVGEDGVATYQDWDNYASFDAEGTAVEYQRVGRDITDAVIERMKH